VLDSFRRLSFWILCPSSKNLAAIMIVPKIINNEKLQSIGDNTLDLVDEWLKSKVELIGADSVTYKTK